LIVNTVKGVFVRGVSTYRNMTVRVRTSRRWSNVWNLSKS